MKYTISYDNKDDCIIGRFSSEMNIESLKEYTVEIVKFAKIYDCKQILNDLSSAHIDMSISDLYSTPGIVDVDGLGYKLKRAVIVKEIDEDLRFFETTAKNQLLRIKFFTNEKDAKEWLLKTNI